MIGLLLLFATLLHGSFACSSLSQSSSPKSATKIGTAPVVKDVAKPAKDLLKAPTQSSEGLLSTETGSTLRRHLGPGIKTFEYGDEGYTRRGGGPADDLSCDFEGKDCCWRNPSLPRDQLDWSLGSGNLSAGLIASKLGAFRIPSGQFLVLSTEATAAADEAHFLSCSIHCSRSPVQISMRHWQTYEALVQVCTKSSLEEDAPLLNCQELLSEASPGPTTLTLPSQQLFDIVIVASNLVEETGNVVLIDDIQVKWEPCHGPAEVSPPKQGGDDLYGIDDSEYGEWEDLEEKGLNGGIGDLVPTVLAGAGGDSSEDDGAAERLSLCSAACDFEEGDACGYVSAPLSSDFAVATRRFKNRATGIRRPAEGRSFAAVFLRPSAKAALRVAFPPSSQAFSVAFKYYEVTQGIQLRGCCGDGDDCPIHSDISVSIGDRDWKEASFECPARTRSIRFLCDNLESNQGACGVDHIRINSLEGEPLC